MSSSLWRWKNCGVSILNLKFFHCSFFSLMLRETFNMKYNFNKNDLLIPFVSDLFAERKGYLQFVQYMGHHFIHKYTKHSLKKVPNQLSSSVPTCLWSNLLSQLKVSVSQFRNKRCVAELCNIQDTGLSILN